MSIASNIVDIKRQIAETAFINKRSISEISLIAVSKTKPNDEIAEAIEAGQIDFGENRPQELVQKAQFFANMPLRWHLIGQLQTNKVKMVVPYTYLIHSIDSIDLLNKIHVEGQKINKVIHGLIQVNISNEAQKNGIPANDAKELLITASHLPNIIICGLMGIATHTENQKQIQQEFKLLKNLLQELHSSQVYPYALTQLSIGMTDDFRLAIAEGATFVRIGSAIFGHR